MSRACTKSEQAMVDGMHSIISQIRNFDAENLSTAFISNGADLTRARLLIFGEKHTEIISQIETLAALNFLAREGDYLLLEGSDKQRKYVYDCALFLIFQIYVNWQWETQGKRYTISAIKDKEGWRRRKKFNELLRNTHKSFHINDLNISKLMCGFWDDSRALADTFAHGITADNFERRNRSKVEAINKALVNAERLFVITGFLHMPMGDYIHNRILNRNNPRFPNNFAGYYELLKEPKKRREFNLELTAGTTAPIYNYLINNNILFNELIHARLLY
jgi:hypothetical protein